MRVGNLVRYRYICPTEDVSDVPIGLVVQVDDSHRQTAVSVLFSKELAVGIWEGHLEVINE